ncbi:MAG TPA: type II toxin-antitoxin system Phd/YefM family antitoxin [Mycobacteriales bacterium]|jgi:prevent-host-death family protein
MDALPLTDAKAHLSELVDRVEREHDRVTVTKNGRVAAVLISQDELAGLEETLDVLADPELMASLRESRRQAAAGDLTDLADAVRPAPARVRGMRSVEVSAAIYALLRRVADEEGITVDDVIARAVTGGPHVPDAP